MKTQNKPSILVIFGSMGDFNLAKTGSGDL